MDIWTRLKIESLHKQKRRTKRTKREERFATQSFNEQLALIVQNHAKAEKQKRIKELFETIRALQMIGADASKKKAELDTLLKQDQK